MLHYYSICGKIVEFVRMGNTRSCYSNTDGMGLGLLVGATDEGVRQRDLDFVGG